MNEANDLIVGPGQPEEARHLLEASHRMMTELFDPDSNHFLSLDALRAPEIRFFVARIGDRVVGCGALARRAGYGEIKSMFVDPDIRGKGAAVAIMASLEAEARAQSLDWMKLETGNLLHAAHRLYGRCGFELCGPFGDYEEHPQSVFMQKRLD